MGERNWQSLSMDKNPTISLQKFPIQITQLGKRANSSQTNATETIHPRKNYFGE
jgi:hypothetical protein